MSDDDPLPPVKSADDQDWSENELEWQEEAMAPCQAGKAVIEEWNSLIDQGKTWDHDGSVIPYDREAAYAADRTRWLQRHAEADAVFKRVQEQSPMGGER